MHRSVVKLILCQLSVKFRVSPDFCVVINVVFVTLCRISFLSHSSQDQTPKLTWRHKLNNTWTWALAALRPLSVWLRISHSRLNNWLLRSKFKINISSTWIVLHLCGKYLISRWLSRTNQFAPGMLLAPIRLRWACYLHQSDWVGFVAGTNQIALDKLLASIRWRRVYCPYQLECAGYVTRTNQIV